MSVGRDRLEKMLNASATGLRDDEVAYHIPPEHDLTWNDLKRGLNQLEAQQKKGERLVLEELEKLLENCEIDKENDWPIGIDVILDEIRGIVSRIKEGELCG